MPGRRPRRLALAVGVVAVAATLAAARVLVFGSPALGPGPSGTTTGIIGPVGERGTIFVGDFEPHGHKPVHVRSVRVTGVPNGMRIVAVYALDGGPPAGANHGGPDPKIVNRLRPVTDMVFRPGAAREEWGLVVVVEATKPGVWVTTGLDVSWKAGWRRGTTHYDYHLKMTVSR
jgi:hypothetical protein